MQDADETVFIAVFLEEMKWNVGSKRCLPGELRLRKGYNFCKTSF